MTTHTDCDGCEDEAHRHPKTDPWDTEWGNISGVDPGIPFLPNDEEVSPFTLP